MLARRRHPPADVARRFALGLRCWSSEVRLPPTVRPSPNFCACYLRPWLGSPLASLPYPSSCTSGLWMTSHLYKMAGNRGTRNAHTLNDSEGSSMYLILQRVLKLTHHRAARDRGRSLISTIALFSYHFFHCIIRGIITIASIGLSLIHI